VANSLNLYFDTVSSLGNRYGSCKEKCLSSNPALAKELRDSADETVKGQKTKYFDPMSSDPCLSECRAQFYFVYKRINKYMVEDRGFYIEGCQTQPL
jgi:hypothetical protein